MAELKQYDVFISYRRDGGDKYARTIQQSLEKKYRVFLDFDELKDGVFDQRIIDAISSSPVFLLILSRGALDRCVNEDDWVRQEILYAVKCGSHIVPVTIIDDNFEGLPSSLPEELRRAVGQHQFSELQMKTLFKASMDQLIHDRIAPYVHRKDAGTEEAEHKLVEDSKQDVEEETQSHLEYVEEDIFLRTDDTILRPVKGKRKLLGFEYGKEMYGYADETGRVVISYKWKDAWCFSCGLAKVKDFNGKLGLINKKGKVISRCQWKEIRDFSEGMAAVNDSGYWGFINMRGQVVVPCEWYDVSPFCDGMAWVTKYRKYGFVDKTGKLVSPCQWGCVRPYSEGLAAVRDDDESRHISKNDTLKWGFINKTGNLVIPCQWESAEAFSEGLALVRGTNKLYGFIDKTGKLVIPCEWREAQSFREGLARVMNKELNYGFIDKRGTLVIPYRHYTMPFSEGLAAAIVKGGWGFIDKTGAVAIPGRWKEVESFSEGLARVKDDKGKFGFINKTGKVVIPCKCDVAESFSEGLAVVRGANGRFGYIDQTGKLVISCQWTDAKSFRGGFAQVRDFMDNYWIIDRTGKVVK